MKKMGLVVVSTILAVSGFGCSEGSSNSVTGPSSVSSYSPPRQKEIVPFPGTSLHLEPIDMGDTEPLIIWIKDLTPPIGGVMDTQYDKNLVTWACRGPTGREAWISMKFVLDGYPDPALDDRGGGSGPWPCDAAWAWAYPMPDMVALKLKIHKVRFMVWIAPKGEKIGLPERPSDVVRDQVLDWNPS